jgi:hypothetical protein
MSILEKTPGLHKSAYRTRRSTLRRRTAEDTQKFPSPHAMCAEKRHVCFTPESGHVRCTGLCLLWANSGH